MGCDLYLHVEVKVRDQWKHWCCPDTHRDYALFRVMSAGDPRGLPDDVTPSVREEARVATADLDDADEQRLSWLNSKEIEALEASFQNPFGNWRGLPQLPPDIQDFRFIFWFDSAGWFLRT